MRFGMYLFFQPFKFGVWNMEILTLSPNCEIKGARRVAHDGFGSSLVPLNASVKMDNSSLGLFSSASFKVATSSCSVFPMYKVDRKMRRLAPRILAWKTALAWVSGRLLSYQPVDVVVPLRSRKRRWGCRGSQSAKGRPRSVGRCDPVPR